MLKLLAVLCAVWHVSVATQIFTIANALVQTFQSNDDGSVLVNLNGAFPFFTKQYTSAYVSFFFAFLKLRCQTRYYFQYVISFQLFQYLSRSLKSASTLVNFNGAFPFFTKQYTSAYAYEPENVDCFFFAPLVFYLFLFNSYKIRKHHRQGVCNGPVFHGFICTN